MPVLHHCRPALLLTALLLALLLPPRLDAAPVAAAPAPMLASSWPQPAPAVQDYLFSEKLDGVRARWDGQRLVTRSGNRIAVPASFTAGWPAQAMDGELWIGPDQFDAISALVRRRDAADPRWQQARFHAFDLPGHGGGFSQRHTALQALVHAQARPSLTVVPQRRLTDHASLQQWLARILAAGGEGLMAQHQHARYQPGRSALLFKIKPWHDAEATVLAHLPGRGKYAGQVGALQVRDGQGRVFAVGSGLDDAQRRQPPPLGSQITYRYTERTASGQPRFPRFVRIRADEPHRAH